MPDLRFVHTHSDNADFRQLAAALEEELKIRDGDDHAYYSSLNEIGFLPYCLVIFIDKEPVASGAFRLFAEKQAEMKRVYVKAGHRGKGIATLLLRELEQWALQTGFNEIILETGLNQPEAIALYNKAGYVSVEKFGKYLESPNSICFKKYLLQ